MSLAIGTSGCDKKTPNDPSFATPNYHYYIHNTISVSRYSLTTKTLVQDNLLTLIEKSLRNNVSHDSS
jgi:hypothetical protein